MRIDLEILRYIFVLFLFFGLETEQGRKNKTQDNVVSLERLSERAEDDAQRLEGVTETGLFEGVERAEGETETVEDNAGRVKIREKADRRREEILISSSVSPSVLIHLQLPRVCPTGNDEGKRSSGLKKFTHHSSILPSSTFSSPAQLIHLNVASPRKAAPNRSTSRQ